MTNHRCDVLLHQHQGRAEALTTATGEDNQGVGWMGRWKMSTRGRSVAAVNRELVAAPLDVARVAWGAGTGGQAPAQQASEDASRLHVAQARWGPGNPSSTTKLASVRTGAPGRWTVSTTRRSVLQWPRSATQRR